MLIIHSKKHEMCKKKKSTGNWTLVIVSACENNYFLKCVNYIENVEVHA